MQISTLTVKYQTTIPTDVRKELGLHAGDKSSIVCVTKNFYH
ncbi:MAG: hypothetical protein ACD_29C00269G0003 [uncultured bacterium]|nr:MAG: hypothetical protein ACD_29C00269G0003 [uncultured bacterium]